MGPYDRSPMQTLRSLDGTELREIKNMLTSQSRKYSKLSDHLKKQRVRNWSIKLFSNHRPGWIWRETGRGVLSVKSRWNGTRGIGTQTERDIHERTNFIQFYFRIECQSCRYLILRYLELLMNLSRYVISYVSCLTMFSSECERCQFIRRSIVTGEREKFAIIKRSWK